MDAIWYFVIGLLISSAVFVFITENKKGKWKRKSSQVKASSTGSNSQTTSQNVTSSQTIRANTSNKTNSFSKIFWTIATIVLVVAILVFLAWALPFIKKSATDFFEDSSKTELPKSPDVITEHYPLNINSKKIRVYTHDGYTYERFSGGWKYYCTPQNGEKTIRGDGNSREDGTVRYFDLEFYEAECIITVIFTKNE